MVIQKDVFWKAALITAIVFILGVSLGSFLESSRIKNIRDDYKIVEVEWADAKLQSSYFQILDPKFCDIAIKENLNFADHVYEEGLKIERYENANKLNDENELLYEKQRYTLFKIEFWLNSIYLKEKCKANYTNVVYFYLDKPAITEKSKQDTLSLILKDLKNNLGQKIMLIPIPLDLNVRTVDIIKNTYNITTAPTLLINEKIKLEGLQSEAEIKKYV
ncbi:MAG: hypothetical protein V1815_03130 [Candidatus Woesearchaeota archaeon]